MRTPILLAFLLSSAIADLPAADIAAVTTRLDAQFAAAWSEAGITPAPAVDDARYLRRI